MMAPSAPVNALVVDDHAVFAEALARALSADDQFASVTWAQTADEGLAAVRRDRPALVIVDLRMPGVTGVELVTALKGLDNPPLVLVLSVADDTRSILDVFEAGADGYLGKHESFVAVIAAVRSVLAGDVPISASMFTRLLPRLVPKRSGAALTDREEKVLLVLAEGCGNEEIAERLDISVNTTRNHVSNILRKLEVESRAQAIVEARERGLIPG